MGRHQLSGTILDVPVGYGRFQSLLHEFGPVWAADWGFLMTQFARERVGLAEKTANCSAEALPFPDNSVDGIFCFRLLQHMHKREERVAIYKEFQRVSRKWILVSLYQAAPLHLLHRRLFPQPSRITMLDRKNIIDEMSQAGLKLIEIKSVLPGLHAHRICLLSPQ